MPEFKINFKFNLISMLCRMSKINVDVYNKNFNAHKLNQSLELSKDLSRKSSVDKYIIELISFLNNSENYFTTSSCSGRFIAFAQVIIFDDEFENWL